jgi:hypothetical protein
MHDSLVVKITHALAKGLSMSDFAQLAPPAVSILGVRPMFPDTGREDPLHDVLVVEITYPTQAILGAFLQRLQRDSRVEYAHVPSTRVPAQR